MMSLVESGRASVARRGRNGATGVVAGAGAHLKFAGAVLRLLQEADLHGTERAVAGRVGGVISDRVLIANIAGDLVTDGLRIRDIFGEEGDAAGGGGQFGKSAARLFHVAAVVLDVVVAKDPDAVDQGKIG